MGVDLRPFEKAAMDVLGIVPPDRREEAFRYWRHDRWLEAAKYLEGRVATEFDHVCRLMTGERRHKQTDAHFEVVHRMLGLHLYDLRSEEVWARRSEDDLVLSVEEFTELLRKSRHRHVDPLHLVWQAQTADMPLKVSHYDPAEPRFTAQIFDVAEDAAPRPEPEVVDLALGRALDARVEMPGAGRLLLINVNTEKDSYAVLNELMGVDRNQVYRAHEPVVLPSLGEEHHQIIRGEPGSRTLLAVCWPEALDPANCGLADVFARRDHGLAKAELQEIGAAVKDSAETAEAHPERRVHAKAQRIRVVERVPA